MGDMVAGIFGGGGDERRAKKLQEEQRQEMEKEKARLARVEEGRNKLRSSRRGLLAFSDDDPTVTETLGGETGATGTRRRFKRGSTMNSDIYDGVMASE
jgi:hypothetical protein